MIDWKEAIDWFFFLLVLAFAAYIAAKPKIK
jgi:hypothetical protein